MTERRGDATSQYAPSYPNPVSVVSHAESVAELANRLSALSASLAEAWSSYNECRIAMNRTYDQYRAIHAERLEVEERLRSAQAADGDK